MPYQFGYFYPFERLQVWCYKIAFICLVCDMAVAGDHVVSQAYPRMPTYVHLGILLHLGNILNDFSKTAFLQ